MGQELISVALGGNLLDDASFNGFSFPLLLPASVVSYPKLLFALTYSVRVSAQCLC